MKEKQLLFSVTKKDFEINWFSGTGAGGQHRNKHQNCCRLTHKSSGIMKTGQSNRNREQNLQEAFVAITKDKAFNAWLKTKSAEQLGILADLEDTLDRELRENIKVEIVDENGKWVEEYEE